MMKDNIIEEWNTWREKAVIEEPKMQVYYWKDNKWLVKTTHAAFVVLQSSDVVKDCRYPTKAEFKKDYKKIPISFPFNKNLSQEHNFGKVYNKLNSDNNPLGTPEMQQWLRKNKLKHTSMSVGDIIELEGKYWITLMIGWEKLSW